VDAPSDDKWGKGNRPVIHVSWEDAFCYAGWLSLMTGKNYRLPTEAEWEYAARAKSTSDYFWGMSAEVAREYAWFGESLDNRTHPVGEKNANGFRLHDMAGNVWEWVKDCYNETYEGAPSDGTAWEPENPKDCGRRVIRGGSSYVILERDDGWETPPDEIPVPGSSYVPVYLRSAYRDGYNPVSRHSHLGFRLAQDL
jgi:formylglycine-generating enzyme required for sulfatase activity